MSISQVSTGNCSFCGKSQEEVKLIASSRASWPSIYICSECILLCVEILTIEQFWCPYCGAWVEDDVHLPGHHNDSEKLDANWPNRWRVSTDGGKTWKEE